ncbi:MAG: hypothetical protein F6J93_37775 [Oscillatoria sp. SIO1A7]|nr:hypothetical protein [Oscillatoria sp. SIO1A7]
MATIKQLEPASKTESNSIAQTMQNKVNCEDCKWFWKVSTEDCAGNPDDGWECLQDAIEAEGISEPIVNGYCTSFEMHIYEH